MCYMYNIIDFYLKQCAQDCVQATFSARMSSQQITPAVQVILRDSGPNLFNLLFTKKCVLSEPSNLIPLHDFLPQELRSKLPNATGVDGDVVAFQIHYPSFDFIQTVQHATVNMIDCRRTAHFRNNFFRVSPACWVPLEAPSAFGSALPSSRFLSSSSSSFNSCPQSSKLSTGGQQKARNEAFFVLFLNQEIY